MYADPTLKATAGGREMKERFMDKSKCVGCYLNDYNNGLGSAKECWSFTSAELILRKEVSVHQRPPWTQEATLLPNCYQRTGYVYVRPDQER